MGGVAPCNANYCVINYRSIGVEFNFTTIFNRHIDSIYIYSLNLSNFRTIETLCGLKKEERKKTDLLSHRCISVSKDFS